MNESDRERLRHMLDASREALSFIEGRSSDELLTDRMLLLSLVKEIEIVGEAAARVSNEYRAEARSIPWSVVVGIRNRLVHGYFDLNLDVIWSTLTDDLPPLVVALEKALSESG